jgi:hypothetical protein
MRFLYLFLFVLATSKATFAQHQEVTEKPDRWKNAAAADTNNLLHVFKKGTLKGHLRYFLSLTDNAPQLTDYAAHAFGGGLHYETGSYKGFSAGLSGFYVFNLGAPDFTQTDPITKQPNRYEVGLFDVSEPGHHGELSRLEEFYLKYRRKGWKAVWGRQLINTPLINLQDGRMKPVAVEGLWAEWASPDTRWKIEGGWLTAFSPRSTVHWYKGGSSIGLYPVGIDIAGKRSAYAGQVQSKGVALLHLHTRLRPSLKVSIWNVTIENVMSTTFAQADWQHLAADKTLWSVGVQALAQQGIGQGGNALPELAYTSPEARAYTAGAKIGWKKQAWDVQAAYNRITAHGRYLFPREWGRDPFFTFMPRERNEGLGDVHAWTLTGRYSAKKWKFSLATGHFQLPDVRHFALNKYAFPSYWQANADFRYSFGGYLKGLESQLLVVHKRNTGQVYDDLRYLFNKTDMWHVNWVLNYYF